MKRTALFALLLVLLQAIPAQSQKYPQRQTIQVGLIDRTFFPQPVFVAIQNGYFADLVILNSNPLDDIARASDIDTVMKNGVAYPVDSILK